MKINNIDIEKHINIIKEQLEVDATISPALKMAIEMLLMVTTMLINKLGLNSKNSSKPPASDPNREKTSKANEKNKKVGGQNGHIGTTLKPVSNPDHIHIIPLDLNTLPKSNYKQADAIKRQVFDIEFKTIVTEYQAQVLIDDSGKRHVAPFPEDVTQPVQYGDNVKAHAVYLSQYQLLPYDRIREYFKDQLQLPMSAGTIYNFNFQMLQKLHSTNALDYIKSHIKSAQVAHADETSINLSASKQWLHTVSTTAWTYIYYHAKRGSEATKAAGILPEFGGILVHDHWKPYFKYQCQHSLCNAHHLRELERAAEQDKQAWAKDMQTYLLESNKAVHESGGKLGYSQLKKRLYEYKSIIAKGEIECPTPTRKIGQKGRLKQSKSRNLLDRLKMNKKLVLRFMINPNVPFTNNLAERDIRMTKVQQKISGCFRSENGARIFCGLRSYLSSCSKQGICASTALKLLLSGHLPASFMKTS